MPEEIHLARHRPHAPAGERLPTKLAEEDEMRRLMTIDGRCFKGRFSLPGEEAYPPCDAPAVAQSPETGMTWCEEHRHPKDLPYTYGSIST